MSVIYMRRVLAALLTAGIISLNAVSVTFAQENAAAPAGTGADPPVRRLLMWCVLGMLLMGMVSSQKPKEVSVLNKSERKLYDELQRRCEGRTTTICPKMRLPDAAGAARLTHLTEKERELALRLEFTCALLNTQTMAPIAMVDLDVSNGNREDEAMKASLCKKIGLHLVRVKEGRWKSLDVIESRLP